MPDPVTILQPLRDRLAQVVAADDHAIALGCGPEARPLLADQARRDLAVVDEAIAACRVVAARRDSIIAYLRKRATRWGAMSNQAVENGDLCVAERFAGAARLTEDAIHDLEVDVDLMPEEPHT